MLLKGIEVFFAMIAVDYFWAWCVRETVSRHAAFAGLLSASVILLGGIVTVQYVTDIRLLLPAAMGAFCGTYLCTRVQ